MIIVMGTQLTINPLEGCAICGNEDLQEIVSLSLDSLLEDESEQRVNALDKLSKKVKEDLLPELAGVYSEKGKIFIQTRISNYGVDISLFVSDLPAIYKSIIVDPSLVSANFVSTFEESNAEKKVVVGDVVYE